MNELSSVEDLAEYLWVPVNTIYAWRKKNYAPAGRKIGKYVRYRVADVHAWVESRTDEVA